MKSQNRLKIEYVSPDSLVMADYNPRAITDESLANLEASLSTFDCVQPLVVRAEDMTLCGGHQRLRAMRNLGWDLVPIVRVDIDETAAKALNITLNSQRAQGQWDPEKLADLLTELTPVLDDYPTGFTALDIPSFRADAELDWTFADIGTPELSQTNVERQDMEFRSRPVVIRIEDTEEFYGLAEELWQLTKRSSAEEWGLKLLSVLREQASER